MDFTIDIFLFLLRHLNPIVHIKKNKSCKLRGLLFLKETQKLQLNCAYLCTVEEIVESADSEHLYVSTANEVPKELNDIDCDYILFKGTNDLQVVMNYYMQAVVEVTVWETEMRECVCQDRPLRELLHAAKRFIISPIVIYDSSFTIICASESKDSFPAEYNWLVQTGYALPEIMKQLKKHDFYSNLNRKTGVLMLPNMVYPEHHDIHRHFCSHQLSYGYATIFLLDDTSKGYLDILNLFFFNVELWFIRNQNHNTIGKYNYELFLSTLADKRYEHTAELQSRMDFLNLKAIQSYCLILLDFYSLDSYPTGYILKRLIGTFPEFRFFSYKNQFFLLCVRDHTEQTINFLFQYFSFYEFNCYVSGEFNKLVDIYFARIQCEFAKEMAAILNQDAKIIHYCKICHFTGAYLLKKEFDGDMCLDERHRRLKAWDREKGTSLSTTVKSYLKNNCDRNLTASELFYHRNTVSSHIKKASEVMECDLQDFTVRMALLQSYLVEELYGL